MKKISFWAKYHVWQSRTIIIVSYILLNALGIFTGKLLREINFILPEIYFNACAIAITILWIFYPDKKKRKSSISPSTLYIRRKFFDLSLITVTFLMIVFTGNNFENLFYKSETAQAFKVISTSKDSTLYNNPFIKKFIETIKNTDLSKLTLREKKNLIKHQIREIKHDKELSKSDKTLLIIVSILVAMLLIAGIGTLACSIACGGSEGLAFLVFFGGTALIIFLLVRFIKHLGKKKKDLAE